MLRIGCLHFQSRASKLEFVFNGITYKDIPPAFILLCVVTAGYHSTREKACVLAMLPHWLFTLVQSRALKLEFVFNGITYKDIPPALIFLCWYCWLS